MEKARPPMPPQRRRFAVGIVVSGLLLGGAIAVRAATGPAGEPTKDAALVAAAALPPCPTSATASSAGGGLPALTLPCLGDGPSVRLSGLRGMPTVVNIWAGPCPPCKREAPLLQRFFVEGAGRVRVLGVVDGAYPDTFNDALDAARGLGIHYPSVFDAHGRLPAALRVRGIPVTLLIDASGRVKHMKIGELRQGELQLLAATYLGVAVGQSG